MELADEFCLRHWSGKAAVAAAFRRPLFSVLQQIYATMDWAKQGTQVVLSGPVLDEILRMSILLPLAETDLTSPISMEISCADASPRGGGCSVATAFKEKSLLLPLPLEDPGTCAHCGKTLDQPTWRTYGCPRKCGLKGCPSGAFGRTETCVFENGGMSRSLVIRSPATTSPSPRPRASRGSRHSCRSTSRSRATGGTSKRSRQAALGRHGGGRGSDVDPLGPGATHLLQAAGERLLEGSSRVGAGTDGLPNPRPPRRPEQLAPT